MPEARKKVVTERDAGVSGRNELAPQCDVTTWEHDAEVAERKDTTYHCHQAAGLTLTLEAHSVARTVPAHVSSPLQTPRLMIVDHGCGDNNGVQAYEVTQHRVHAAAQHMRTAMA